MKIHILYSYINLRGANTPIEITYSIEITYVSNFVKIFSKLGGWQVFNPPHQNSGRVATPQPPPPPRFGAPVIHTYLSNKINKYLMYYT